MQVFKCDSVGRPDDEESFIAVELDSTDEINRFGSNRLPRSPRPLSAGDGTSLIVVFKSDGTLARLPGYGSVHMTAEHAAYLAEMREAVATFVAPPIAATTKSKAKVKPAPSSDTDD